MKRTSELSNKTKAELTAMARRKKIPVASGMAKDELIKTIQKGLRKIEAQKKSKTATAKTRKRTPVSKTAKQTPKKKKAKAPKVKTARKPAVLKKSPVKGKPKKTSVKKSATRKPKTVQSQARPRPIANELPERYGDHRLVVLVRDPNWAYAYWDLSPAKVRDLLKSTGQTAGKARWILRVYTAALHSVEDKTHYFDVDTLVQGGNYYLNLSRPGARFIVEIGVMDTTGLFRATAQSNPVIMPMDHPSETLAQESTFSEDIISRNVSSFSNPSSSRSQ